VAGQDCSVDLDLPDTGESETITTAIFENTCESAFPYSHWLYTDLTSPPPPLPFIEARFAGYDNSNPAVPIYRGTCPSPNVPFQIPYSGTLGIGGAYEALILAGPSTATAAAHDMPGGMTPPAAYNAIAINLDEDGLTGWRLKVPSYAIGQIVGATPTGKAIIYFHGGVGTPTGSGGASVISLPIGTFGSPDATTYNRDTDAAPVQFNFMTAMGLALDEDDNVVLYYNYRTALADARGMIYSVTAEQQVSGNVTLCSEES
jgi:hypothetical protein